MAVSSKTITQLKDECERRGIAFPYHSRMTRYDFIKLLSEYELARLPLAPWSLKVRNGWESPMLVYSYKHLKPHEQKECMTSDEWVATEKINGCRCLIFYHPDEGFSFYSRHRSVADYLPINYTDNIIMVNPAVSGPGRVRYPSDFKGVFKVPFILDGEVKASGLVDTSGYSSGGGTQSFSELNSTAALLSLKAEFAREIQVRQSHLEFFVFDVILYSDRWQTEVPYSKRSALLQKLVTKLSEHEVPFKALKEYQIGVDCQNFQEVFKKVVDAGGEGLVLKRKDSLYTMNSTRRRNYQVKLKRTMSDAVGSASDIDAFIIGHTEATEGKAHEDFIGGVKLASYIRKDDGTTYLHHIGSCSAIPFELRKLMTVMDGSGKPKLNPKYYEKVVTINGMGITPRVKRFSHCVISWDVGFRSDKTPDECVLDEDILNMIV